MEVRRAVLGDEHVDRAIARTTDFTADFQDLITRYAWGEIWTRPGLDRRTRSCITLTALVAGGHEKELAMHVRARAPQRPHARRDQGGPAADRDLLRRPRRQLRVRDRSGGPGRGARRREPHPGRDRRRRPCRARAGAAPPPGGDRLRRARSPQPRVRREPGARGRPRARDRRAADRARRRRAAARAGARPPRPRAPVRGRPAPHRPERAHRAGTSPSTGSRRS